MACATLPNIHNGKFEDVTKTTFNVGDTLKLVCDSGYSRNRAHTTCLADGTWEEIRCTPKSCGEPPYLENGKHIGNVYTFPASIKYKCNDGYTFKGSYLNKFYCNVNGIWTPQFRLECVPDSSQCPTLPPPENGGVQINGFTATYSCDEGYRLVGNATRKCEVGMWDDQDPPVCVKKCPKLPEGLRIIISSEKYAKFLCEGKSHYMECKEGEWTIKSPYCINQDTIPSVPINGTSPSVSVPPVIPVSPSVPVNDSPPVVPIDRPKKIGLWITLILTLCIYFYVCMFFTLYIQRRILLNGPRGVEK